MNEELQQDTNEELQQEISKILYEWSFGKWYNSTANAGGFRIYKWKFEYWLRLKS